ncbi:hypothetical protein V426_1230 [Acinetobacter baumannii UH9907]|nr:hypothetical protein ACINNAV7_A2559 [Acinetobacter baumannii Naval-17]ETR48540.1 hypothetical protein V426_1230 [Acinetobacter baumannii UH9907]EXA77050.1 hypothetical protein J543_3186 [Acinetobacter baumannii 1159076]EXD29952.1 hypothetical protein J461_3354 [Acinetobacter baumannii 472237-1196]EXD66332.1 hypothetical protein J478_2855 [Acinetobacter baumannii 58452]EXG17703.1 hypothetical protein J707_3496 [Acinetobacter baumannii 470922]EXH80505.1 hypothetical protein J628_2504 [Acinet
MGLYMCEDRYRYSICFSSSKIGFNKDDFYFEQKPKNKNR